MEKLTIKHAPDVRYSEAYSKALRFTFLNPDKWPKLTGYHCPVKCKDFLQDMLWTERTGKKCSVYGFEWEPGMFHELSKDTYYLGLDYPDESLHKYQASLIAWMQEWELKLPPSTIYQANDGQLVVEFDSKWAYKPAMISLFTLLLRLGLQYDGTKPMKWLAHIAKEGNKPYGPDDHQLVDALISKGRFQNILSTSRVKYGKGYKYYEYAPHGYGIKGADEDGGDD